MSQQPLPENTSQSANNASGNVTQVGGNYSNTMNVNLFISLFFISILALGGLAWMLNIGFIGTTENTETGQQQSQPTSTTTTKTSTK